MMNPKASNSSIGVKHNPYKFGFPVISFKKMGEDSVTFFESNTEEDHMR